MPQLLLRHFPSLCVLTTPAQAHFGHHDHHHQATKASGGGFTLVSASGPVALKDFRGKVVAIYFGYTHCLDICPLDLGKLGNALKSMKPEDVEQIQPVFIMVDPARNDAKHLAEEAKCQTHLTRKTCAAA